jgi:hypothetical protein
MTKLTVEQAIKNLTESVTAKPKPIEVVIANPQLKGAGDLLRYWLSVGLLLQFRTAVVWGFLATFFPQLGITWFMVMFGLWAIRHAIPPKISDVIRNLKR